FRHALMRDAAYELQTPSDRGGLHALALAIIEDLCGGAPMPDQRPWIDSFQPHASDSYALELATHAELAGEAAQRKAALYLLRAAQLEAAGYRMFSALALYRRLAELPGADDYQRAVAHMDAGQVHYRLGELEQAARAYDAAAAWIDPTRDPAGAMQLKTCRTIVESHTDNDPQ